MRVLSDRRLVVENGHHRVDELDDVRRVHVPLRQIRDSDPACGVGVCARVDVHPRRRTDVADGRGLGVLLGEVDGDRDVIRVPFVADGKVSAEREARGWSRGGWDG